MDRRAPLLALPALALVGGAVWLLGHEPPPAPLTGVAARPPAAAPRSAAGTPVPAATEVAADLASPGPGVRLRGVRGRCLTAEAGAPVAGVFVSWGQPPREVLDALRAGAPPPEGSEGQLTDAEGRFDLARAESGTPRYALHATGAGWVPVEVTPGLREEVELRLERSGRLAVRFTGAFERSTGVLALGPDGGRHEGVRTEWPPVLDVHPGTWRLHLDGARAVPVEVARGELSTVELRAPAVVTVAGTVGATEGSLLRFTRTGELDAAAAATPAAGEHVIAVGPDGRFLAGLPAGVYAAQVLSRVRAGELDHAERFALQPVRVFAPGPVRVALALAPAQEVQLRVRSAGAPPELGLVSVAEPAELVALRALGAADPSGEALFGGKVPAGRWSVFAGPTYVGDLDVALGTATPPPLVATPFPVSVRWRLPDGLRPDERVRGTLAVLPAALGRRRVGERFVEEGASPFECRRGGPPTTIQLLRPGRYRFAGVTDLGPFAAEAELTGPGEVEVPLTEAGR